MQPLRAHQMAHEAQVTCPPKTGPPEMVESAPDRERVRCARADSARASFRGAGQVIRILRAPSLMVDRDGEWWDAAQGPWIGINPFTRVQKNVRGGSSHRPRTLPPNEPEF